MARYLPRQLVAAAIAALAIPLAAAGSSTELVRYGFDEDVATGPDTLRIYQNARGTVRLASEFHLEGYRSVEIRDRAGDGDFPELLGRFPLRTTGLLRAHFGLLLTDPTQSFNVALAGPNWFALRKDGIAFWLQGRGGTLYHVSDSIPKRLLPLRGFVWYVVDVSYDVGAGTYDLTLREEGSAEPAVSLREQPNATAQPGSSVNVFSFIGDQGSDDSDVVYYVDEIVLTADRPVEIPPFAAPGRRKLFVDSWNEQRKRLASGPVCFPVGDVTKDLGLDPADVTAAARGPASEILAAALDSRGPRRPAQVRDPAAAPLAAVLAWAGGCEALQASRIDKALSAFERAESLWPRGRMYPLSRALALARADRVAEADRILASIEGLFRDDLRLTLAQAMTGLARDDLERARSVLAPPAEGLPIELGGDVRRLAEQYFFVLLWKGSFDDALRYASAIETQLRAAGLPTSPWTERIGDAAFFGGDPSRALEAYRDALGSSGEDTLLYRKLADACFRLGDLEQERVWREKVYGSLR